MSSAAILENGLRQKRTAVKVEGLALLSLSFQALGIIYSDIGTSPLYVLNAMWPASGPVPSEEDIIGGLSAIIWSLTLLPLIKYVFISLYFGTKEGEGGTFALYQSLYPPETKDFDGDRTLTGDSLNKELEYDTPDSSRTKEFLRWPLLLWCLFGTALTMSDGIFTPAVSVTSAVGGMAVAKSSISENIIPISIAFLLVLFFVQQFGTARLAFTFGPISFLWFLLLASTGIYNIVSFPGIFRAFDPSRAVLLFVRTKDFDILSGILLAVTGCEAVFANLGQFNASSIRISFTCIVYPSLVLAYLGQGARLIADGESVINNIFYRTIPGPTNGPLFWILFIFAILATVIASQAMITATFSLVQQVVNMKGLPPIRMLYTSDTIQGQVYIPAINWALMIAIVIIVAVFKDLEAMTNAYGFAVATVMISTSVLISVQMHYVKRWPVVVEIGFFLTFGFFDALFWGASLKKVPHGAWVPLAIGTVLMLIMWLWTWAKRLEDEFDGANRQNLRHFIYRGDNYHTPRGNGPPTDTDATSDDDELTAGSVHKYYYLPTLRNSDPAVGGGTPTPTDQRELARIPTCAVFHKLAHGRGVPHSFIGLVRQWPALPQVLIFLSVCVVPMARVPVEDRYILTKVRSIEGFYGATYYVGYRDDFDVKVDELIEKICTIEIQTDPQCTVDRIQAIRDVSSSATHIVPHYHVISRNLAGSGIWSVINRGRRYLVEDIYRRLATMFPETANWLTPADEIIYVGINAEI